MANYQPLQYLFDQPGKQARFIELLKEQLADDRIGTVCDVYELIAALYGADDMGALTHYLGEFANVIDKAFDVVFPRDDSRTIDREFVKELKRQARRYQRAFEPTFSESARQAIANAADTANAEDLLRVAAIYNPQDKRTRAPFRKRANAPRILRALPDNLQRAAHSLLRGSAFDEFGQDKFAYLASAIERYATDLIKATK